MKGSIFADRRRRRRPEESSIQVRALLGTGLLSLSILGLLADTVPTGKPTNYPDWWFSRDVVVQTPPTNVSPAWPTNYPTADDYAAINQGQLKNFATAAYNELQAKAPTYIWSTPYGTNLTTIVNGWNPSTGDAYATVNLGQLKTVGAAFYNVLIQLGYTNNYPWTGTGADDYAVANIGQTKNLFSFDVGLDSLTNGVPDWWETKYLGSIGYAATNLAPAGNGLTLLQDYQQGNDPNNYYSQGGAILAPAISVVSGNSQTGPSATFYAQPLVVKVADSSGNPLVGAPVTFTMTGNSGGGLATALGGNVSSSFVVATDASGTAQAFCAGILADGSAGVINVTAGSSTGTFTESTVPIDTTVAAASNVTASPGIGNGETQVTWVNNASNATYFVILKSTDGVYWTTVTTINSSTATNYIATGLDPRQSFYFGVIAGNPN
jgi:hypothetical protein